MSSPEGGVSMASERLASFGVSETDDLPGVWAWAGPMCSEGRTRNTAGGPAEGQALCKALFHVLPHLFLMLLIT